MKNERAAELINLAEKEFGELSSAERLMFGSFTRSEAAVCSSAPGGITLTEARRWGSERTIRARLISWLCENDTAAALSGAAGLQIVGARIDGMLGLPYARVPFALAFVNCAFPDLVYLRNAEAKEIALDGSWIREINAGLLRVEGSFLLRSVSINGELDLTGASIAGNLDLTDASVDNPNGYTLKAEGIQVAGSIFLNSATSKGEVFLLRSSVSGDLQCEDGKFLSSRKTSLCAQNIRVAGNVFLRGRFQAEGLIDLRGAKVGMHLECIGAHFANKGGVALAAETMEVGGVFLEGVRAEGKVSFAHSIVKGQLESERAEFMNAGGASFFASGVEAWQVLLRNIQSRGEVDLNGALIKGDLEFDGSHLVNPGGRALRLEEARVGNLFLRDDFTAEGGVGLTNAVISSDLLCSRGRFLNEKGDALIAENVMVGGRVSLANAETRGKISLAHANIEGHLRLVDLTAPEATLLDLRWAKVGTIEDDERSWPAKGQLLIDGLSYAEFDTTSPTTLLKRLTWLRLQPHTRFFPQPYEQLSAVFMKEGRDSDAKEVQIAKNQDSQFVAQMPPLDSAMHWLYGKTVSYGHKPLRALWWMAALFAAGIVLFQLGYVANVITPSKEFAFSEAKVTPDVTGLKLANGMYPRFNAAIYSLDMFLPLVNLHLKDYWLPNWNRKVKVHVWRGYEPDVPFGAILRVYLTFHILAGWVLTTLFIAGLTGLIKK